MGYIRSCGVHHDPAPEGEEREVVALLLAHCGAEELTILVFLYTASQRRVTGHISFEDHYPGNRDSKR